MAENLELQNIHAEEQIPEPDEIMAPEPNAAQEELWNELYETLDDNDLASELEYASLNKDIREYLASEEIASRIKTFGAHHELTASQIADLAWVIKSSFIESIRKEDLTSRIKSELNLSDDGIRALTADPEFENLFKKPSLAPVKQPSVSTPPQKTPFSLPPLSTPSAKAPWEITVSKEASKPGERLIFKTEQTSETRLPSQDKGPLILHEEKSLIDEKNRPTSPGFSFPLKWFKPKQKTQTEVTATVETPNTAAPKPQKVVHYNEFSSGPAQKNSSDIGIKLNGPKIDLNSFSDETSKLLPQKEERPQPKIEGNTVHLR